MKRSDLEDKVRIGEWKKMQLWYALKLRKLNFALFYLSVCPRNRLRSGTRDLFVILGVLV